MEAALVLRRVLMTQHPLELSAVAYKPTARKDDSGDSRTNVLKERGLKFPRAAVETTFLSANVVVPSDSISCKSFHKTYELSGSLQTLGAFFN